MMKTKIPTRPLCFRVPECRIDQLERMARERSYLLDKNISAVDLCREALEQCYPMASSTEARE